MNDHPTLPLGDAPRLPEPEAHARTTDPVTSHEAAASVESITQKQEAVLTVFRTFGGRMHLAALVANYRKRGLTGDLPKQSDSGIRTRAAELVERGRLVVTPDFHVDPGSGRRHRILALP